MPSRMPRKVQPKRHARSQVRTGYPQGMSRAVRVVRSLKLLARKMKRAQRAAGRLCVPFVRATRQHCPIRLRRSSGPFQRSYAPHPELLTFREPRPPPKMDLRALETQAQPSLRDSPARLRKSTARRSAFRRGRRSCNHRARKATLRRRSASLARAAPPPPAHTLSL